ncbi:hypothetical protein OC846_003943 [Tilletia horrida]|uniref:Uncharacterized protein n=1 Tax=Tilletia horrida TaxID=155126 RepID=A0AAN6GNN0_9BASI|nr:hypothetical protein OC845_003956 [Tilletia horrida]KAK0549705.1 hypothetical protein OC846_003943 [Tilletia horrida]KAK0569942.1 hypothetical protein OC861_000392 [Tilletia horrida]
MDPSPLGASEGNNTDVDASRTSAPRFWSVPELVNHLLKYLDEDRVDLLTLSQVSKVLRAQALRAWVRYLDVPVAVADKRVKLFSNNPSLLAEIHFLRLCSDVYQRRDEPKPSNHVSSWDWTRLNHLLDMFEQHSASGGILPLVDLTIRPTDPLLLPECLSQQVVALHIIEDETSAFTSSEPPSAPDEQNWDLVPEIIQRTAEGPGLHTFHIRTPWAGE